MKKNTSSELHLAMNADMSMQLSECVILWHVEPTLEGIAEIRRMLDVITDGLVLGKLV